MQHKLILIALSLLFLACAPKSTVVLLDSGKNQNTIIFANEKGQTKLDKVGAYIDLKDKSSLSDVKLMSKNELNERFSKVLAATPLKPLTYILYFKPNSTELTDESKQQLEEALKSIKERSPCIVDIIGHTDTVGSNAINAKVSLKRAKHVEALIKKQNLKIIALVSKGYGEEDLQVKTKNNKAEAKNRNVEIFIK